MFPQITTEIQFYHNFPHQTFPLYSNQWSAKILTHNNSEIIRVNHTVIIITYLPDGTYTQNTLQLRTVHKYLSDIVAIKWGWQGLK